jgi:SAM-dependent methyltransferase
MQWFMHQPNRPGECSNGDFMTNAPHWDTVDIDLVRDVSWLSVAGLSESYAAMFDQSLDPRTVIDDQLRKGASRPLNQLRGLALVCGDMAAEHGCFLPRGDISFDQVIGMDLSPESLARAATFTTQFPFEARTCDANDLQLGANSLDLAVGMHGIHHIQNLENAFQQLHRALSPKGVLFMYEWIGPEYLQIPFRNRLAVRAQLTKLTSLERTTHLGRRKGLFIQYPPATFDPSEACNSTQLDPLFRKYFNVIREARFGGLMYPLLEGNGQNIDMSNPKVAQKIVRAQQWEERATRKGLIKPLFLIAAGIPK